ncbi:hypothetical protein ACJKIH_22250 [Brucella pseudogrignonensis]|uniref:hypothetical protein n=1 Tax=Brucella pseudogrignonensis TaxID=419475 RepID=UPI0038B51A30
MDSKAGIARPAPGVEIATATVQLTVHFRQLLAKNRVSASRRFADVESNTRGTTAFGALL